MTRTINAKIINTKLKYGWTAEDFANYFGVESTTLFINQLYSLFNKRTAQSFEQVFANNKKHHSNHQKSNQPEINSENLENQMNESDTDSKESISSPTNIDSVLKSLEIQRQDVLDLERTIKELSSKKLAINNSLLSEKKKLQQILEQLKPIEQSVNDKLEELQKNKQRIYESKSLLKSKRKQLEETEKEYEKLSKVTIFVFSYELEISNFNSTLPDVNSEIVNRFLEKEPLSEELTVKQLKLLSQLYLLVEDICNNRLTYEIIFENDIMEQVFNSMLQN